MQIGIIGTGQIGRALVDGLSAAGHDVVLGSRVTSGTRWRENRSSTRRTSIGRPPRSHSRYASRQPHRGRTS